jgi:ketoreductase RED1
MRHLLEHVGSQLTFEIGVPDPAKTVELLDAVEQAYGTGESAYERLVELRDGRTRAVLEPLGWPEPPSGDTSKNSQNSQNSNESKAK